MFAYELGDAIRGISGRGKHTEVAKHYCLSCYPYPLCSVCGAKLRPFRTSVGKWPGTKSKQSSDPLLCAGCMNGARVSTSDVTFSGHAKNEADEGMLSAAFAYVERRNAQDVAWMLGLEENE